MTSALTSSTTRVLISFAAAENTKKNAESHLIHLQSPKSGTKTCYLLKNGAVQEIHWFKQQYSSWFLGNSVVEDGSLYMCSPVDPIFLALPILEKARMKRGGDDQGKFRELEEMLFVEGYPGYSCLQPLLYHSLDAVCEMKDIGSSRFYRLHDDKVLAWLCCKFQNTLEALESSGGSSFKNQSEEYRKAYTVELLAEYLSPVPWLEMLCKQLNVDLEASKKARFDDTSEAMLMCPPKGNPVTKDSKTSNGKSKATTKKGPPASNRKVSEFFALKR